jgi:hypothetical protein
MKNKLMNECNVDCNTNFLGLKRRAGNNVYVELKMCYMEKLRA